MRQKRTRGEESDDFSSCRAHPAAASKRRRRRHTAASFRPAGDLEGGPRSGGGATNSTLVVNGLPAGCTVLELKSRLEMFGPISRIRIDGEGFGYVTFRSSDSTRAATSAALDPAFGITVRSKRVHVCQVSDPHQQWRIGVGVSPPSKLLRAELPLRKHGRSNRKLSEVTASSNQSGPDMPFNGREIIAYDDIL